MVEKDQVWAFQEDAQAVEAGNGLIRRVLAYSEDLMCVENTFEKGVAAPLHSHAHTQIAYISEGVFTFVVDGEVREMKKGDSVLLKSNVPHSCTCVEAGIVLDIFTPMRKDFV